MVGPPSDELNCFIANEASDTMVATAGESSSSGEDFFQSLFSSCPAGALPGKPIRDLTDQR